MDTLGPGFDPRMDITKYELNQKGGAISFEKKGLKTIFKKLFAHIVQGEALGTYDLKKIAANIQKNPQSHNQEIINIVNERINAYNTKRNKSFFLSHTKEEINLILDPTSQGNASAGQATLQPESLTPSTKESSTGSNYPQNLQELFSRYPDAKFENMSKKDIFAFINQQWKANEERNNTVGNRAILTALIKDIKNVSPGELHKFFEDNHIVQNGSWFWDKKAHDSLPLAHDFYKARGQPLHDFYDYFKTRSIEPPSQIQEVNEAQISRLGALPLEQIKKDWEGVEPQRRILIGLIQDPRVSADELRTILKDLKVSSTGDFFGREFNKTPEQVLLCEHFVRCRGIDIQAFMNGLYSRSAKDVSNTVPEEMVFDKAMFDALYSNAKKDEILSFLAQKKYISNEQIATFIEKFGDKGKFADKAVSSEMIQKVRKERKMLN